MAYRTGVVTFLDILGFGDLVDAGTDPDEISRILDDMESEAGYDADVADEIGVRTFCVSDCVIRTMWTESGDQVPGDSVGLELLQIGFMQLALLNGNLPVRGGVTFGEIHLQELRVFGPAYQQAYRIESKTADYPRIVVDSELIEKVVDVAYVPEAIDDERAKSEIKELLLQDRDGQWFIDYLRIHAENYDEPVDAVEFLRRHKELIEKRLQDFAGTKAVAKYWWMRRYHNRHVEQLNVDFLKALDVKKEELRVTGD